MRYIVNEACIGCGLCEGTCPAVFRIENGLAVAIPEEVPPEFEDTAREAMEGCPVSAIEEA